MDGVPSSRGYTGGFGVDLMRKDLSLAVQSAYEANIPVPLGAQAQQMYSLISSKGNGGKDFSYAYKFLADADKQ
jgi:3-hydroxyisobutyrate dehydrogenase